MNDIFGMTNFNGDDEIWFDYLFIRNLKFKNILIFL